MSLRHLLGQRLSERESSPDLDCPVPLYRQWHGGINPPQALKTLQALRPASSTSGTVTAGRMGYSHSGPNRWASLSHRGG